MLLQSDGLTDEYGSGLIWSAARIRDDNLQFRTCPEFAALYMPFESLLFFGDAGDGDQFAFAIVAGKIRRPDVLIWNHENDSRTWVAPSLEEYLRQRLAGSIV